jgi:archaetidylinositol phosphate synthase
MKSDIRSHRRINDIFLASLERPALNWLAEHMPPWMTPDILTGIGLLGSLVTFVGYCLTGLHKNYLLLASFGFVVNWFGDSMDGSLARYRHIERPYYGFFIDHSMDIVTEVLIFLGLGLSPYVRFDFACLALIGYLMLSVLVYIRTCVKGEFKISYAGLGPTEARLIAIGANTIVFFLGNPSVVLLGFSFTIYDWIALAIVALLLGIFTSSLITQSRIMSKIDSQPKE